MLKRTVSLTVLLSIHNICFGGEIKKIFLQYALLYGGLDYTQFLVYVILSKFSGRPMYY